MAAAAIKNLELFGMDMSNCFQSDTIKPEDHLWLEAPICYMEWFHQEYPEVNIKPASNVKYVLQTINGMQGHKDSV